MRNRVIVLLATLAGAVFFADQAQAQLRPWEISIAGGPSFATGDFSNGVDTGYHVQGSVGFDAPLLPVGLRVDLLWQELPVAGDANDDWIREIGGLANAVFEVPLIIIQPYGLAGVGVMRHSVTGDSSDTDDDSETTVGVNAGLGVEFPFVGLAAFLEARYMNIFGSGNATDFRTIPVTVGIRF
jgi:opacity protein-like surface antigen